MVDDSIQTILCALNLAGWQTGMAGDRMQVLFWARHRQSGKLLKSQGLATYADQVARYLAERCGVEVDDPPAR